MRTVWDILFLLLLGGLGLFVVLFALGLFLGGLAWAGRVLYIIFYPLYFLTLKPVLWAIQSIRQSRCPHCGEFFKRQFVKSEVVDEGEVRKTVNRVDRGIIYIHKLTEPNQDYEVTRKEQVSFVQQLIHYFWKCKDPDCGHEWYSEEYLEFEGSLGR